MKETIGIKGKVVMIEHESNDEIDPIMQKYAKGEELTFDEETKLISATKKTCTVENTIMDRYIDRIVSLMGWARGYQYDSGASPLDDRAAMANQLYGRARIDSSTLEKTGTLDGMGHYAYGMFPELIKLGWGETDPTTTDTDLAEPFDNTGYTVFEGERGHKGWKNIWTTKEGTIKPYTQKVAGGLEYTNSYIARHATIYTTDDINALEHPIREVGLYFPLIFAGAYPLQNETVYFDMNGNTESTTGGTKLFSHNKVWSILNYALFWKETTTGVMRIGQMDRYITDHDRGQQSLPLSNFSKRFSEDRYNTIGDEQAWAIVTYTPHVEYVPRNGGLGGFGTSYLWPGDGSAGGLAARQVLPVSFIKNPNHALTVLWYIYFKIEDRD